MSLEIVDGRASLTLRALHALTEPMAQYESSGPDVAGRILRRGIVEEAEEVIRDISPEGYQTLLDRKLTPEQRLNLKSELGDVCFYLSELSRYYSLPTEEVFGGLSDLRSFQAADLGVQTPIYDLHGNRLQLAEDYLGVFAVTILRVADLQDRPTPWLWHGMDGMTTLGVAVGDVARASAYIANRHGVSLQDAFVDTIEKLRTRVRNPHVIDEASQAQSIKKEVNISPQRLYDVRAVGRLVLDQAVV